MALTRGTCFLACRLEFDAVAGLQWISWCVLGRAGFFSVLFLSIFFSSNAHSFASFTSLLVMRQGRESEATEAVFSL